jgi:hypothetical protein
MHISLASRSSVPPLARPGGFARSARQREWDNDQAAWEARLRKIAGRVSDEEKPVRPISLAPTILEPAGRVTRLDALLLPRTLPAFVGTERTDLACVACSGVIGQAITARSARREHPEGDRLVVRCTCGAFNLLARNRDVRGR